MQILTLLPKVAQEIGAIAKNRKNEQQGYQFRGIDDVLNAVHGPLCKHGITPTSEVADILREERPSKTGGVLIYTRLTLKVTWHAPDGSTVSTTTAGEAMDSADKSTNKAMSAALKYAYFQTFSIPLEEEDADATTPEPAPKALPKPEPKQKRPEPQPIGSRLAETLKELGCTAAKNDADTVIQFATRNSTPLTIGDCRGSEGVSETVRVDIEGYLGGIMATPPGCERKEACQIFYANAIEWKEKHGQTAV